MYKIKTKIWEKIFNIEEVKKIFFEAGKIVPCKKFDDDLSSLTNTRNYFAHLETDISNDTVGIKPKQIKQFLKNNEIEDIPTMLIILTYLVLKNTSKYLDEDNQIQWDKAFKDNINNKSIEDIILSLSIKRQSIKKKIAENIYWLFLDNDTFSSSFEATLKRRQNLWKEHFNMIPKDDMLTMFVMPLNFNGKQAGLLAKEYGALPTLDIHTKFLNVQLLRMPYEKNMFKYDEAFYSEETITETEKELLFKLSSDVVASLQVKNIVDNFEDYPFIDNLIQDLNVAAKSSSEFLFKIYTFHLGLMYHNVSLSFDDYTKKKVSDFGLNLPMKVKAEIANQHGFDNAVLYSYYEAWESRSKTNNFSGSLTIDKYTISICEPDDTEQLVLGEMTDCCQLIGGAGERCLISGLKKKDQGFVKITKRNQVYAQSWFWTKDDVLCFDSIECPPSENVDTIVDLYIKFSQFLSEKYDFNIIYTGRDGNRIPQKVFDLPSESTSYYDFLSENIYTDTTENGMSILYEKEQ